jgi:hypothetical protein
VTLKRATLNAPLTLGDEFTIQAMMPNAMPEERNSNFLMSTLTAYVPEVTVNTAEGEQVYRLMLQFVPERGVLRVTSMEDGTHYAAVSGEPMLAAHLQALRKQIDQAEMPAGCSDASLYGIYGYTANGTRRFGDNTYDYYEIGVNYFDGQGALLNVYTNSLFGGETFMAEGSYSVTPDCLGQMDYGDDWFTFVAPPTGDRFYYTQQLMEYSYDGQGVLVTTPGGTQAGWMERQSKSLETHCTAATLKGTYAYGASAVKTDMVYTATGLESFDGAGKVTNIYTDSKTGQTQYAKGSYTIDQFCDALVSYESGDKYRMHVAPDGASLLFLQIGDQNGALSPQQKYMGLEERVSMLVHTFTPPAAAQ